MTNSVLWVDLTQTSFESQELSLINYVVSCLLHVVKSFHRLLFNEESSYQQGRGGVILCRPPGNINSKSNVNGKTVMVQFGANCKVSLTVTCVTSTWQMLQVTSVTKTWQEGQSSKSGWWRSCQERGSHQETAKYMYYTLYYIYYT